MEGSLEISRRRGFQKIYDLPDRVIPGFGDLKAPSDQEYACYIINRSLKNSGLASLDEITHLRKKDFKNKVQKEIKNLVEEGTLIEVKVENLKTKYYAYKKALGRKNKNFEGVELLSPFDNLTIHRNRLREVFDFDYQIECYVPQPKRRYGYFCLPILKGDQFIGRIDLKANRQESLLHVLSLHSEPWVKKIDLKNQLVGPLREFAKFQGCSLK